MITLPISLVSAGGKFIGKEVAKEVAEELGEKTVKEVAKEAVEKTVKIEVSEEIAESTARKEIANTAESQKTIKKENVLEDKSVIKKESITSRYLDQPADKNGTLNIGAGRKPIEGAYNIDLNPATSGVYTGDATNLTNIASGSQSKIIIENPYGYNPLNPEIIRVLEPGGVIEVTGSKANGFVNKIPQQAQQMGFSVTEVQVPNVGQFTTTNGVVISSERTPTFIKYILKSTN